MIRAEALGYEAFPDGARVLRDITLSVAEGERIGLLGPSGAGKSTLAFHLCGVHGLALNGRTSGCLRLAGKDALEGGPRGFGGLVLQNPESQLFCRTVAEELELGRRGRGLDLGVLLARLGLDGVRRAETATLSLGWKQRVAIASMLAMEPRALFLDEPTNYLDAASADALFDLLAGLEGMTVIVADHDEGRLSAWADRILRLDRGQLVLDVPARRFVPAQSLERRRSRWAPGTVLLEFKSVTFGYQRDRPVIKDGSLALREGEIVALQGPNGAGKTTLMRLAKGLLRPRSGEVACGPGQTQADVGLVFQNPDDALFAPTVLDECAFLPSNLGHAHPRERAMVALERLGLAHLAGRTPFTLSYGEKRRVSLAAVLAGGGRILCLDEPTVGLDRANQGLLADALADHASQGGAVLLATHDAGFAAAVADRSVRLEPGGGLA